MEIPLSLTHFIGNINYVFEYLLCQKHALMSHLISGETDSEKLNDLPKVVWLDVAEVGF